MRLAGCHIKERVHSCVAICVLYEGYALSGGKRGDYQNCSALYCVLKLRSHKHT